jgi:hypothetical protein
MNLQTDALTKTEGRTAETSAAIFDGRLYIV